MPTDKVLSRLKIKRRVRGKVSGSAQKPRFSVYRSNNDVYAQLIDDTAGKTLISFSSRSKGFEKVKSTKTQRSYEVGKKVGEAAIANGIQDVVFDRNGYLYHGRIKSLADGAREAGLKF